MRIVFMGTPEFAVPSLAALLADSFEVVAVVTAPDKPAGRGLKIHESAVKKFAITRKIPVLQPERLKNPAFIKELNSFQADLQVVVAFRMLPQIVWDMPRLGTINLHASLLPQYRGSAPINHAIMNGETKTGVTTFKLRHEIDTGQIIDQQQVSIGPDETAGELHDKLMETGAELLVQTVKKIEKGTAEFISQPSEADTGLKPAPKIFKEDREIHWGNGVNQIYNLIRGLSPYPAAWTILNGKIIKIFKGEKEWTDTRETPGTVHTDHKTFLSVACKGGYLSLKEIQPSGKKRMKIEDFLRGFRDYEIIIGK